MIQEVVQRHIDRWHEEGNERWQARHDSKLAVSEIGKCPRMVQFRMRGVPRTSEPDAYLRRLFYSGKEAEKKLEKTLRAEYGDELEAQVHVENDKWAGTIDFVTPVAVVEHKETGANKFKWGDQIPQYDHLLQALTYKHLLGDHREAVVYYTCRANWAEYRVWEWGDEIIWEGERNGTYMTGELDTTVQAEMEKLEAWMDTADLPPRHKHPFHHLHCTTMYSKNAYVRCDWFDLCFAGTEWEGAEKIEIPKELR